MDTIFALATARGKAGVAVIRVSGPHALEAVQSLAGTLPEPRKAGLRLLRDDNGHRLDEALVLTFPGRNSFTGEDVGELHLHGSIATISAVLRELGGISGLRLAEPGEFTRRALENGRLDLAQVEGLADLIDAETEAQRRQALRVLSGALGDRADHWRSSLIRAAALLEATIDFVDEDVPVDVSPEVLGLINDTVSELQAEVDGTRVAERIREGFEVAIVGPPNVGKSTLLNALAGRDAAITSEIAGTTRDVIEVHMDLGGLPVTVLDTAGLRDSQDVVESLGIKRAKDRAADADLRIFLIDNDTELPGILPRPDDIIAYGKADLEQTNSFSVSGKTGAGIGQLVEKITKNLKDRATTAGIATRERHRTAMLLALRSLETGKTEVLNGPNRSELAAEELRTAIRALNSLVGRVDVEHILDEIFSSFCLGK